MFFSDNDEPENFNNPDIEAELSEYLKFIKQTGREETDFNQADAEKFSDYCLEREMFEEGLIIIRYWLQYIPDSAEAFNKQAYLLLNLDRIPEALKSIDKAIDLSPGEQENVMLRSVILDSAGKHREALQLIEELVTHSGDDEVLYAYANILQSNEEYQKAVDTYLYLEKDTHFSEPFLYQDMAYCYNMLEKYDKALDYYQRAVDEAPFDHNIWYNKGIIHSTVKDYDKAVECYELAIAIKSDFFLAWFNLAFSYSEKDELDKSVEAYKEALKLKPKDLDSLHNLAGVLGDNNQLEEAKKYFQTAVELYPDYAPSLYGLAVCCETDGEYELAEKYFDLSIRQADTSAADALHSKALMYSRIGKLEKSIDTFEQALSMTPDKRNLLLDFVKVMFEFDKFEILERHLLDVKKYFEKMDSEIYPEIYFYLSAVYARKDDFKKAENYLMAGLRAGKKTIHKMNASLKRMLNEFSDLYPNSFRNN